MLQQIFVFLRQSTALLLCASLVACGSSSDLTGDGDGEGVGGGEETVQALSTAFPADLAIASPTANRSEAQAAVSPNSSFELQPVEVDPGDDLADKVAAVEELLDGETVADCDFVFDFSLNGGSAQCYGPTLYYDSHPDGEDDVPQQGDDFASLPSGDLGLWYEVEADTEEACAAAQMNQRVSGIAGQVDSAVLTMAGVLCLANVNNDELPSAAGESVDLTETVTNGFTENEIALDVTSATLARGTDDDDDNAVYVLTLAGSFTRDVVPGPGQDPVSVESDFEMRLKHVPLDDTNETYRGKLSYKITTDENQDPQGCAESDAEGETDAVSIVYHKASATQVTYQLQNANFCGADAEPFLGDDNYTVDPDNYFNRNEVGTDRGWANNFNVATFSYNPQDGTGDFSFAWQAGSGDSHTRVLNITLAEGETEEDPISGVAYFGFGPQVQEGAGSIEGMICNWAGPKQPGDGTIVQDFVQSQTLELNEETGLFEPVVSNIIYAPVNDCDISEDDLLESEFRFWTSQEDEAEIEAEIVEANLIDVEDVADNYTAPTAPSDVDPEVDDEEAGDEEAGEEEAGEEEAGEEEAGEEEAGEEEAGEEFPVDFEELDLSSCDVGLEDAYAQETLETLCDCVEELDEELCTEAIDICDNPPEEFDLQTIGDCGDLLDGPGDGEGPDVNFEELDLSECEVGLENAYSEENFTTLCGCVEEIDNQQCETAIDTCDNPPEGTDITTIGDCTDLLSAEPEGEEVQ